MILIQIIVVIAALSIMLLVLGRRNTHAGRAWKKLGIVFLAICMIVAVLFPELTNRAAHLVGVGRGADLLLYILTIGFITYAVNDYLHRQEERERVFGLARKVALLDANERYNLKKNKKTK